MEWKYVKELKDNSIIENIEKTYLIEIPQYLKEIIINYNGGRPEKRTFNTKNDKEKVLQSLISYRKEDKGNIYIYEGLLKRGYVPFAITEFGDVLCIKTDNGCVELYNHEIDEFEDVCNNIEEFFASLY